MNMYIDKILNSNTDVFYEIIEKMELKNLSDVRQELSNTYNLDKVLIDAIEFTLKKLRKEESFFSQVLYSSFGIGKEKNKRREQLILLGAQLKSEISKLERDRRRIQFFADNVYGYLQNLSLLSEALGKKKPLLQTESLENRCQSYLKDLYKKMDETNGYHDALTTKGIYLESCLYKYKELFRQIPRYQTIKEERWNYLLAG